MATLPTDKTNNPVGSTAPVDMAYNSAALDCLINDGGTVQGRLGKTLITWDEAVSRLGYVVTSGYEFGQAFTIVDRNEVVLDTATGNFYIWTLALPKVMTGSEQPTDAGWEVVSDPSLRGDLSAPGGVSLVGNAFATIDDLPSAGSATWLSPGDQINLNERAAGEGGSATWGATTGLTANGLDIVDSSGVPGLNLELRKGDVLNAKQFGDITTNSKNIIERMVAVGNALYLPSGEYDAAALDVITANQKVVIYGDTPSYDPGTDTKQGTWINGVLSSAGADSIALFDVGVDTRTTTTNEGIVFSDPVTKLDTVFIDRVIVIAKAASNHCLLIENTRRVDVGTVILYGGVQGFAIKSEVFNVDAIFAFDQTTWGCTVRYSPGAPATNGSIGFVYCGTVNNAKGGGVICMNDQQGAALRNIGFGRIYVEDGNAGFFVTNGGNTVSAENITVDDIYISGVTDFAIQTFGPPKGVKIKRAHLKDCSGSIFTNSGACEDYEIDNITIENTPAPALLSGSNHKCSGWTYKGSTGVPGAFIQNESTDLQVFSMDQRIAGVVNQGGGTTIGGGTPSTKYPANGNLSAMVNLPGIKVQKSVAGVQQNDLITLYTLPSGSAKYMLRLQVIAFSPAAIHSRTVEISQDDIQYVASSSNANLVFEIQKNVDNIDFRYLFATTGSVDINVIIDAFHEDA